MQADSLIVKTGIEIKKSKTVSREKGEKPFGILLLPPFFLFFPLSFNPASICLFRPD